RNLRQQPKTGSLPADELPPLNLVRPVFESARLLESCPPNPMIRNVPEERRLVRDLALDGGVPVRRLREVHPFEVRRPLIGQPTAHANLEFVVLDIDLFPFAGPS